MLIEQITKFDLTGQRPFVTGILETGYFQDKTKISKANLRVNYLMLKMLQKAIFWKEMYLASPGQGQVTKFITKIQDFKRVLYSTWSKEIF